MRCVFITIFTEIGAVRYLHSHPPLSNAHSLFYQVLTNLGHLLESANGVLDPIGRWYKLTSRKASDRVGGEICFVATVVPKYVNNLTSWSEQPETLLDPQILKASPQLVHDVCVSMCSV